MGILSKLKSAAAKTLDVISAPLSQPVTTFTKGISAGAQKVAETRKQIASGQGGAGKVIATTALTTGVLAGATLAAAGSAGGAAGIAARKAVTSLIPSTTKGKIAAAVVTPIVAGAVIQEPLKAAKTVAKAPLELAQLGSDVAKFTAEPSKETGKELVQGSPLLLAGAAALGIATVGAGAAGVVSNYLTREEMKKQTAVFERQAEAVEGGLISSPSSVVQEVPLQYSAIASTPTPITPQTMTVSKTTTKKKRRTTKKTSPQSISQRVNVIVSNRNIGMKNYLKRAIYA